MLIFRRGIAATALLACAFTFTACQSGEPSAVVSTTQTTQQTLTATTTQPTATSARETTVASTTAAVVSTRKTTVTPTASKTVRTTAEVTIPRPTVNVTAGRKLVWSDEFDGTRINPSNWSHEYGFVRNHEPQFYTDRPENAFVSNGKLTLRAIKEQYNGAQYTSASLYSNGKKSFKYGVFEMRCKMPAGPGCWPAFWTMGINYGWPRCGEIDIFEWYSPSPNTYSATVHWNGVYVKHQSEPVASYLYKGPEKTNLKSTFHTYGMIWTETGIQFYADNYLLGDVFDITREDMQGAFNMPHYILANLALSKPDLSTFETTDFVIDYIRVYQ